MFKFLLILFLSSPPLHAETADALRDFILSHRDKPVEVTEEIVPTPLAPPKPSTLEIKSVAPDMAEDVPLGILYKPEVAHSLIYYDSKHLEANFSFFGNEYNKIEQIKDYLGELSILDPILSIGVVKLKDNYFYKASVATEFYKERYGLYFKLESLSADISDIKDSSYGRAMIAYYYNIGQKILSNDFITVYAGWKSDLLKLNLDNLDSFKSNFNFERQKDNFSAGIYYMPFIEKRYSFNAEVSPELTLLSFNFKI